MGQTPTKRREERDEDDCRARATRHDGGRGRTNGRAARGRGIGRQRSTDAQARKGDHPIARARMPSEADCHKFASCGCEKPRPRNQPPQDRARVGLMEGSGNALRELEADRLRVVSARGNLTNSVADLAKLAPHLVLTRPNLGHIRPNLGRCGPNFTRRPSLA